MIKKYQENSLINKNSYQLKLLGQYVWFLALVMLGITVFSQITILNTSFSLLDLNPLFMLKIRSYIISLLLGIALLFIIYKLVNKNGIGIVPVYISLFLFVYMALVEPIFLFDFAVPNDQLGFVLETQHIVTYGNAIPIQGDFVSLGHAYLFSVLNLVTHINTLKLAGSFFPLLFNSFIFIGLTSFIVYIARRVSIHTKASYIKYSILGLLFYVMIVLDPWFYGRMSFGVLLTFFLMMIILKLIIEKYPVHAIPYLLLFSTIAISYPASSMITLIILFIFILLVRLGGKKEISLFFPKLLILSIVIWFLSQVVLFISGQFIGIKNQLYLSIGLKSYGITPFTIGGISKSNSFSTYINIRELNVFVAYLLFFIIFFNTWRWGITKVNHCKCEWHKVLLLFSLSFTFVVSASQIIALSHGYTRPYFFFSATSPIIFSSLLILRNNYKNNWLFSRSMLKIIIVGVIILGNVMSPIVKWGSSPLFYASYYDEHTESFIGSYTESNLVEKICSSGAHYIVSHLLLLHYMQPNIHRKFYSTSTDIFAGIPIKENMTRLIQESNCYLFAMFYKTVTSYIRYMPKDMLKNYIYDINLSLGEKWDKVFTVGKELWNVYLRG